MSRSYVRSRYQYFFKLSPIIQPDKCLGTVAQTNKLGIKFFLLTHGALSALNKPEKCLVPLLERYIFLVSLCLAQVSPEKLPYGLKRARISPSPATNFRTGVNQRQCFRDKMGKT